MKTQNEIQPQTVTKSDYIKQGALYAGFMFVFMVLIVPFLKGEKIHLMDIVIGIPLWIMGGFLYVFIIKKIASWQKKKAAAKLESDNV